MSEDPNDPNIWPRHELLKEIKRLRAFLETVRVNYADHDVDTDGAVGFALAEYDRAVKEET